MSLTELEPFGPEDFDRLIGWVDSPERLFHWAGVRFTYPLDHDQLERHLERAAEPGARILVRRAVIPDTGEVVGHLELSGIDSPDGCATLRRLFVDGRHRRHGVGTAIVCEMLAVAFDELGLHRVEGRVFSSNRGTLALYDKLGFAREGTLRESRRFDGRYLDTAVISILRREWLANRGRFEAARSDGIPAVADSGGAPA
jgi:RimJ/RimL family protein N-acetyltransferase